MRNLRDMSERTEERRILRRAPLRRIARIAGWLATAAVAAALADAPAGGVPPRAIRKRPRRILPPGRRPAPVPPDRASLRARYAVPEDDLYLSPIGLAFSPDGRRLFLACEGRGEVLIVDPERRDVEAAIPVGAMPFGMAPTPDGRTLYVSLRDENAVAVVDLEKGEVTEKIPVGDDPHGVLLDAARGVLYVADLFSGDVTLLDLAAKRTIKRLFTRAPFALAASPDGRRIFVSNQYANPAPFRTPPVLELVIIDAEEQLIVERRPLPNTVIGQGIAVSPDGDFVAVALEVPRNLIPETQIYQGWMVTHGFAFAETRVGGRTALLLLDEPNLYFADPYGIAFSRDGRRLFVGSSGVDRVSAVDVAALRRILEVKDGRIGVSDARLRRFARHLGLSGDHVLARIPTGYNPKGIAASPDGRRIYVADRLSDTVTIIDAVTLRRGGRIDLGGPRVETQLRWGERLFNYASISFQKQLSCNTCHPETHLDGLVYDIAADGGMGLNLVDNRTLRGIGETAPFKWSGKNPTLYRQEGPRAAQLFFRSHGFEGAENDAIVHFIQSRPIRENRHRPPDGRLNEFQRRGKRLFERDHTNDGRYIPIANRCITCHPPPFYTDRRKHDIGSRASHDTRADYDTPQLSNIHLQAPYMHDGRCFSLEEIWTVYNPYDTHGTTNDMTKQQLNDLIEFLKTL